MITRDKRKFSRYNQPVKCRGCEKLTTWSDANGYGGLELCRDCFDAAGIENEHFDGYHETEPHADCPKCKAEAAGK